MKDQHGLTLLLTTHYMDEAQQMADKVGIMDHGRIVVEGSPSELIDQMGADTIRVMGEGENNKFAEILERLPFVQVVTTGDGVIQIGVDSGNKRLAEIVTQANSNNFKISDISIAKPSLGDVFLKYTGRELRDK